MNNHLYQSDKTNHINDFIEIYYNNTQLDDNGETLNNFVMYDISLNQLIKKVESFNIINIKINKDGLISSTNLNKKLFAQKLKSIDKKLWKLYK